MHALEVKTNVGTLTQPSPSHMFAGRRACDNKELQDHDEDAFADKRLLLELTKDGADGGVWVQKVLAKARGKTGLSSEMGNVSHRIKALLVNVVNKMKRQNKWRSFSRIGRGILSLCIRLPIMFRGYLLLRSLARVLKESLHLLSPIYRYWVDGVDLAYSLSRIASVWGVRGARSWRLNDDYVVCLGMNRYSSFSAH